MTNFFKKYSIIIFLIILIIDQVDKFFRGQQSMSDSLIIITVCIFVILFLFYYIKNLYYTDTPNIYLQLHFYLENFNSLFVVGIFLVFLGGLQLTKSIMLHLPIDVLWFVALLVGLGVSIFAAVHNFRIWKQYKNELIKNNELLTYKWIVFKDKVTLSLFVLATIFCLIFLSF